MSTPSTSIQEHLIDCRTALNLAARLGLRISVSNFVSNASTKDLSKTVRVSNPCGDYEKERALILAIDLAAEEIEKESK